MIDEMIGNVVTVVFVRNGFTCMATGILEKQACVYGLTYQSSPEEIKEAGYASCGFSLAFMYNNVKNITGSVITI